MVEDATGRDDRFWRGGCPVPHTLSPVRGVPTSARDKDDGSFFGLTPFLRLQNSARPGQSALHPQEADRNPTREEKGEEGEKPKEKNKEKDKGPRGLQELERDKT